MTTRKKVLSRLKLLLHLAAWAGMFGLGQLVQKPDNVDMPEERPAIGDVLYMVDTTKDGRPVLGYWQPHGAERDLFPYWRQADSIVGADKRCSDAWLSVAINDLMLDE